MPAHARKPSSAASDGGSESSLTDMPAPADSRSRAQARASPLPQQPRTPPPAAQPAQVRNRSVVSKTGSETSLSSLSSLDSPQRTQPTQDRNPSAVSRTGTESSLSSLTSTDSDGQQRPRTPNTRNARDVPGLTFSPSTVASSPESHKSYGFSAVEDYPGVGNAVREILESQEDRHSVENLYAQAQKHLKIFDNELYASLDIPEWVSRVSSHTALQPIYRGFTVRKLVDTMYRTAEDLGLEDGKKYVMAAVCSCAVEARDAEDRKLDLAERIQRLASTWAAFLLWPFFAQEDNKILSIDDISVSATPTTSETASLVDKGLRKSRDKDLREEVLKRDDYRCVLTGHMDLTEHDRRVTAANGDISLISALPARFEKLEVAHIFKRSVVVYDGSSNNAKDKEKFRSTVITLEILRHYCSLNSKYLEDMDLMDQPGNAMSLIRHYHTNFDDFLWCLKPTKDANCYQVEDYKPGTNYLDLFSVPTYITFKDHTVDSEVVQQQTAPSGSEAQRPPKRPHEAVGVDLPDPELLRLHAALTGVLRMSGAAEVFQLIMERRGPDNPPVPSGDGKAFMNEVVDSTMHRLRVAVSDMRIVDSSSAE